MIRRPSLQSFDDNTSTVDDPQIDPAAAQWHNWAAMASKQNAPTTNTSSSVSPDVSSSHPSTLHNQSSNGLDSLHSHHEQPEPHSSSKDQDLELPQMDPKVQSLFSEPPLCFCQKLASQSESAEFGVIYECHFMTSNNSASALPINLNTLASNDTSTNNTITHICGFHVHWLTWKKMGDAIKRNQIMNHDDPELGTCPYFNFTYCVAFRVFNSLKKSSPLAPRCFCNRRVVLSECEYNQKRRICFVCPNFYIDGAKPKCSWFLWAEELAFNRPKYPRHSPLLIDEAISRIRPHGNSHIPNNNNTNITSASTSTSTTSTTTITTDHSYQLDHPSQPPAQIDREQHTLGLLSALTSGTPTTLKVNGFDSSLVEKQQCLDGSKNNNSDIEMGVDDNTKTSDDDGDDLKKKVDGNNDTKMQDDGVTTNNKDGIPEYHPFSVEQQYYYTDLINKYDDAYHQITVPIIYGSNSDTTHYITPEKAEFTTNCNRFMPPSVIRKSPHNTLPVYQDAINKENILQNDQDQQQQPQHNHHHPQQHTPHDPDNKASYINLQALEYIMHHQSTIISALKSQVLEHNQQMKDVLKKQLIMEQDLGHLRDVAEKANQRLSKENQQLSKENQQLLHNINSEITLRQKNQQQLAHMEESLENLLEENTTLAMEARRNSTAPREPPKCQVCYSADVECAVVPCFHSAYCLDCAQKLKECALCRMPKFSIQKVYLC